MNIPIIYNASYGVFSFSSEAINEYKIRCDISDYLFSTDIRRDDATMAQIVEELGDDASGDEADIRIWYIPEEYKSYYDITTNDGKERIILHHDDLKVDKVNAILNSNLNTCDKLTAIQKILN